MAKEPLSSLDPVSNAEKQAELDAGEVSGDGGVGIGSPKDPETRQLLAYLLVGLLALIIVGHYVVLCILEWNGKKTEALSSAFNTSLPVVSGLVSAACAYYFAKEQQKK